MRNKKKILITRDTKNVKENGYDEMKKFLHISRKLNEQTEVEAEVEVNEPEVEEKTKEYKVSGGLIITHGLDGKDLELTSEEQSTYTETMEEFVDQVSDLVDYGPLNIYKTNVEWSGNLVKFDVDFYYTIGENNGVYIDANLLKIDDDFMEVLGKLKQYYEMFSNKWAAILSQRKKTETDVDEVPDEDLTT